VTNRGPEDRERPPRIHVTDKRGQPKPPAEPEVPVEEVLDTEDPAKLAEERLDQLLRLKADFENYRKRVIREQTELVDRASLRIVERLIPVLDDLDRALAAANEHQQFDAIVKGIQLVQKQLQEVLVEEGLERVTAEGAFDPHEHEAVSTAPGAVDEPTVLQVVRPGYKLKGKTIRPVLVHVSVPDETQEGSE
jgi:molecular chaperone GrpE